MLLRRCFQPRTKLPKEYGWRHRKKEFRLYCEEINISNDLTLSNQAGIILELLIGHTELMKIESVNIDIGIRGVEALGSILQNPSSKLKSTAY